VRQCAAVLRVAELGQRVHLQVQGARAVHHRQARDRVVRRLTLRLRILLGSYSETLA